MSGKTDKDKWHPAFVAAMELDFREYRDVLDFEPESSLSKEPLKMDLLIIKKKREAVINNDIGIFFQKYNIIEYKSPEDGLTIDDYSKTMGYALIYKGLGEKVNAIPFADLTVTLMRDTLPKKLFAAVESDGGTVTAGPPGIYYLKSRVDIPCQFVLTRGLGNNAYHALRLLTNRTTKSELENFLKLAGNLTEQGDRDNISAVLTVSMSANQSVYLAMQRRLEEMFPEVMLVFRKEVDEWKKDAADKAKDSSLLTAIKNLTKNLGISATKAMDSMGIPKADQARYAAML